MSDFVVSLDSFRIRLERMNSVLAEAAASADKLIQALNAGRIPPRERVEIEKALMRGRTLMRELVHENGKIETLLYCATAIEDSGH